jgi:hypothetical protein
MDEQRVAYEQLGAVYRRFAEAQAGTVAVAIRNACQQRRCSLVHLRNLLRVSVADFRRLEQMPLPSANSFVADVQSILATCHLYDWAAFAEVLGGQLLLASLHSLSENLQVYDGETQTAETD